MKHRLYSVPTGLLFLAACTTPPSQNAAAIEAIQLRHDDALIAFEAEKQRLAQFDDIRGTVDFGPLGELVVHNVELTGWPESAFLRAEFTWINTGERTRSAPTVQLSIIDDAGDDWRSTTIALGVTYGIEYGTGSTHSAWLRLPTEGLHLRPGWTWGLDLLPTDAGEAAVAERP